VITKKELIKYLQNDLPGESAQWKMAPVGRRSFNKANDINYKMAAVLIAFQNSEAEPHLILTLRSEYDGVHSAQVSFPGGKFDSDETDAVKVALREMEEETGVHSDRVEILGVLSPLYIPVSGMLVQPVVGWIENITPFNPDPREVQRIMQVSFSQLISVKREFANDLIPSRKDLSSIPYFNLDSERVWGATAMMLSELLELLGSPIVDKDF
jgi:8-oxo-dGTP pyrophosphatase MutT (NUDIX family)